MFSPLLLVLCLCLGVAIGVPCRQDWEYFVDSCYGFGEITTNWAAAQDICHSAGGKLAEIESAAENTFLKTQASQRHGLHYWLGGTDLFHEGVWTWISTGELISFTDWGPGQPDDYQSHQDCLFLSQVLNYTWDDELCDANNYFICEREPEETTVVG